MADGDEDFTFPATTAIPPSYFFESPPLWRRPEYEEVEDEGRFNTYLLQQQLKNNGFCRGKCSCYVDSDNEEKMDLLWEDLDEKYSRNCGKLKTEEITENSSSPGRNVQICCVRTLKMSKSNRLTINGLKASIVVLIRFLMKKDLAMHNSSDSSVKKLAW